MFKHLTRTLKLGLTTLAILTTGAVATFAQPAGFNDEIDPIADCSRGGSRLPSYCTIPVINCINNPFGSGCATTLGTKGHTVAKVRYCRDQDVPNVVAKATAHACHDTWGGVNAAHWAKQKPDAPDSPNTDSPRNQFLKGTADGVDTAGVLIREIDALYFDTAMFDGRALGGDATDGVAFFWGTPYSGGNGTFHAGILSGTDLGAPIMQKSGTASWVGQFQAVHFTTNKDFVLEVTFGNADTNKAGTIKAFVHRQSEDSFYHFANHFYIDGYFNNSGLISGKINSGNYTNNDREDKTGFRATGALTGLIGQEGAVGVFYTSGYYSGGFVARPAHLVMDKNGVTAQVFLDRTCIADPFENKHQEFCNLEYADDRVTRINDCITGGNASNTSQCGTAIAEHECIENPFASECKDDFTGYYKTARANRIQFCLDSTTIDNIKTSNLKNNLCTGTGAKDMICKYAPFAEICFDDDNDDNDDNDYDDDRKTKYTFCRTNINDPSCTGVTDRPNAIAWADSFAKRTVPVILTDTPDTANRRNQFLKDLEDKSAGNLDQGDILGDITIDQHSDSLNLNTATFNGNTPLGGDAADGVAFFRGQVDGQGTYYYYAGLFPETDLGAPLGSLAPDGTTTASWVGRFQSVSQNVNKDFVLEVDYAAQSVNAFVQYSGTFHFYLDGDYNAQGVITGTVDRGTFINRDREGSTRTPNGTLTGLIGKDGAVGAFISNYTGDFGYAGGFVARPANTADKLHLNGICDDDPFGYLCYLEKDKQRDKIIECTEGSNASKPDCARAAQLNDCLTNPFATECEDDFTDYYVAARTKRIEFCLDSTIIDTIKTSNLANDLCTDTGAKDMICKFAPFAEICFDEDTYKSKRKDKIDFCHANVNHLSCTGVKDNPNAVAWDYRLENRDDNPIILTDAPDTADRRGQFLKNLEDKSTGNLDVGDIVGDIVIGDSGSLNLHTATFNGTTPLGDAADAADGVAFFRGQVNAQSPHYWYAGIFSGTDLGVPVTDLSGTASWVGRFQAINWSTNKEFVLEIDFDGTGDKAGYIKAFVQRSRTSHFYLVGSYNAQGVITGTVDYGFFRNSDRDNSTRDPNGTLTGLIGKDGAVGAFISNPTSDSSYSGGFVARPAKAADKVYVDGICDDDPFGYLCYLETDKQHDKIIKCTKGSNARKPDCARAVQLNRCLTNPFDPKCETDFTDYYVAAREKRNEFCVGDLTNSLCTGTGAKDMICKYAPFAEICFDEDDDYDEDRKTKYPFCLADPNALFCTGVKKNPNAITWADSFAGALTDTPAPPTNGATRGNQFLKNLEDKSAGNLDRGDMVGDITIGYHSDSLNLNTAKFNTKPLGGNATDGVAFFKGQVNGQGAYYYYAGLFPETNLGAPLPTPLANQPKTASWVGRFQSVSQNVNKDFVLEVDYEAKSVDAFVQWIGGYHFYLDGEYNGIGVITGDFKLSNFANKNRKTEAFTYITGVVTGLIGRDGAVGAFYGNNTDDPDISYAGGFVARPPEGPAGKDEVAFLDDICKGNPFHSFCYLEVRRRNNLLEECIVNDDVNEDKCKTAREYDRCITDPFGANCLNDSDVIYKTARTNRLAFCNDDANKDNLLCTGQRQAELCTYDPFHEICFYGNHYNRLRETACGTGGTFTDKQCAAAETRVCGTNGDVFNPLCTDEEKRRDRLDICDDPTKATNANCIGLAIVGLCTYENPFHKVCMDKIYDAARIDFSSRVDFCDTLKDDEAKQTCKGIESRVTSLNWVKSFNDDPLATILAIGDDTEDDEYGQFLQATATGLDLGEVKDWLGYIPVVTNLNLKDATFDGRVLDEDVGDGVAFARIRKDRHTSKYYAGILSGTDLGAPLTQDSGKAYWNGRFQSVGNYALDTDFALEINFNTKEVAAFVHRQGNHYFHLKGTFNNDGASIKGTVDYGPFTNHDNMDIPKDSIRRPATLTGLIGKDGAVGAFYGGSGSGDSHTGYAGGFVASPNVAKVNYKKWKDSVAPLAVLDSNNPQSQFLQIDEIPPNNDDFTKVAMGSVSLTADRIIPLHILVQGKATGGAMFFAGLHGSKLRYYAGLSSDTNLGGPIIPTSTNAEWSGKLKAVNPDLTANLTLKISFNADGGKVNAFVTATSGNYYYLDGDFGANGVITGTVNYGPFTESERLTPTTIQRNPNGTLAGLIGRHGAVGAFHSNSRTNLNGFSGGFAVAPSTLSDATYTEWLDSFTYNPLSKVPSITPQRNQFLRTTETGLNTGVIRKYNPKDSRKDAPIITNLNLATATYNNLPLSGKETNGVEFFTGYFDNGNAYYYAGILSDTNLGAPVNQIAGKGTWDGQIQATNMPAKDFTLEIEFADRTVDAFVKINNSSSSNRHYYLKGAFDDNGVIRGTVDYGDFKDNDSGSLPLTTDYRRPGIMRGLIGQQGAVGVFISDKHGGTGYAGGFVVRP